MPHMCPHRDSGVNFWSKLYGPEPMEIWEKRHVNNVPTICYWTTVREYLLINCRFIRGQRVGHWPLTLNACNELCPWFFAFGHTKYARWLPVFERHGNVTTDPSSSHDAFMEGQFVVQRGDKKFALMALDQSQKHSIQYLKEDSGAKGLYRLKEVLMVIDEFELAYFSASTTKENLEHPESPAAEQNKFLNHLKSFFMWSGQLSTPLRRHVQSSSHWTLTRSWIQLFLIASEQLWPLVKTCSQSLWQKVLKTHPSRCLT